MAYVLIAAMLTISGSLALLIWLRRKDHEHTRQLLALDRVRMAIAAAPADINALARTATESIAELFDYTLVSCWEVHADYARLLSSNIPIPAQVPLSWGICGSVVRDREARLVEDVRQAPEYMAFIPSIISQISVPIILQGHVALVLNVEHQHRLEQHDLQLLEGIATQLGLAVEKAELLSEVRTVQDKLVQSAKMAAIGTLAAGVAHEFNNLLAALLGYAQLGLHGSLEDKEEALRIVEQVSQRGRSITRGLLMFSQSEAREREPITLADTVQQALDLLRPDLERTNIHIVREYYSQGSIIGDFAQLTQVAFNLIANARDAMPHGGTLTLNIYDAPPWTVLIVADSGPGIAASVREKLFEPFVTTKGALGGGNRNNAGLGLAICYGIVQSHGGEISAESVEGVGSSFQLKLPLASEKQLVLTAHNSAAPHDTELTSLQVLVVEDETLIQTMLRSILSRAGHMPTLVDTVPAALSEISRNIYDVVLCDLTLGGEDGLTLVRQLQMLDNPPPVIVITGRIEADILEQALTAGAHGLLPKPFSVHELLQSLRGAVRSRLLRERTANTSE